MSSGTKKKKSTMTYELPGYLSGAAETAVGGALQDYNNPNSNNIFTNLDQQFNRAADRTQTRLDSEFAGAGRNMGASYPARSTELQDLAAQIYSPERTMQYDPTEMLFRRLGGFINNPGFTTTTKQPYFKQGLF